MFTEEYEKLTRGDRTLFSQAVNALLYQCYIVRKVFDRKTQMFKIDPDYLFIERHYSLIEDYLSYMDIEINKSNEDGVIYVTSSSERNHLRIDVVTTLIVYALRSYYEEAIEKAPEEGEVLMSYGALNNLLQETGLSNLTKRLSASTIASSLRTLDSYNVVSRNKNTYGDPSYTFFILPTIKYVISAERMNALYNFLTKPEGEEEMGISSAFDIPSSQTEEKEMEIRTGIDIPVQEDDK